MPDEHARLSPSAASRWISCPASVLLAQEYPHESSVYADEGTAAHTMAEIKAQLRLRENTEPARARLLAKLKAHRAHVEAMDWDLLEMEEHTDNYVGYLGEILRDHPGSTLFLEQRLQTGVPLCWGTADAIIPTPGRLYEVDLKYGKGEPVDAWENPQGMLYGVGALERYDLLADIEEVEIVIYQPRLESVSTFTIEAEDLKAWRDSLLPVAEEALKPGAHFGPSEKACRWCPAAGDCRARLDFVTAQDFALHPDRLSAEELADSLERVPNILAWCKSVQAYALQASTSDPDAVPGWKVVMSNGVRQIQDQGVAIQTAIDKGWPAESVSVVKTKGIGELEKMMGKDTFSEVFGPFVVKTSGSPSLVKATDPRPTVDRNAEAARDFSDEDGT